MKHRLLAALAVAAVAAFLGLSRRSLEATPPMPSLAHPPAGDVETAVFAVG